MRPILLLCLASFICGSANAQSDLNSDCKPRGWIQQIQAWWNPSQFWTKQIPAIQQEAESQVKAYEIHLIQSRSDTALAALDRQKAKIEQETSIRILGVVNGDVSQKIKETLAETDREIAKSDRVLHQVEASVDAEWKHNVQSAALWAQKCTAFSQSQLSKK